MIIHLRCSKVQRNEVKMGKCLSGSVSALVCLVIHVAHVP